MRTTTDYISEYNTETGTTQRETTVTLYTYDELSEEARARVLADYMKERENDPYFGQWFSDLYEREIWDAVRGLEKSIHNARVSWQYNRWYSCDFDCEYSYDDCYDPGELDRVIDNGCCYSMDLCDAWNRHVRKLNGIALTFKYMADLQTDKYPAHEWEYGGDPCNLTFYNRLEGLTDNLISAWYEELEAACEDVRNTIETLLRGEWDYYTSEEYAREECADESVQGGEWRTRDNTGRVYYSDNRKWYTADGVFFDQSDVNHECVSIVKTA